MTMDPTQCSALRPCSARSDEAISCQQSFDDSSGFLCQCALHQAPQAAQAQEKRWWMGHMGVMFDCDQVSLLILCWKHQLFDPEKKVEQRDWHDHEDAPGGTGDVWTMWWQGLEGLHPLQGQRHFATSSPSAGSMWYSLLTIVVSCVLTGVVTCSILVLMANMLHAYAGTSWTYIEAIGWREQLLD